MKSSKVILFIVIALMLVFSGCKKKTGNVAIQFKARFNGQNVAFDTTTFTSNGMLFQFTALKFYLDHINLIGPGGSITPEQDVALIDFSNPNSLTLNFKNLQGDYTGIQFGCGLDSILDNTDPTTAPASSPLNAANCGDMYWAMQKYRFESFDGKWDYTTDTLSFLTRGFSYHVGGSGLYRTNLGIAGSFSVSAGNTTSVVLYLDIEKIFTSGNGTIDIPTEGATQSLPQDNPAIATKFVNNFSNAFTF
jgi:hypothetical protein